MGEVWFLGSWPLASEAGQTQGHDPDHRVFVSSLLLL